MSTARSAASLALSILSPSIEPERSSTIATLPAARSLLSAAAPVSEIRR